jgi:hypothetical protein
MKLLILASPRSGSTTLTSLIKEHLKEKNYKVFYDPFNSKFYDTYKIEGHDFTDYKPLKKYNNLLVKSIILVNYIEYPTNIFLNEDKYIEWCLSFFDKIIVLDRENKKEQAESFVISETTYRLKGIGWHIPKIYNTDTMDMGFYNNMFNLLTKTKEKLFDISIKYNLPYFLYENLYCENNKNELDRLFKYFELNPNIEYINEYINNKNRRVRIEPIKQKVLI